MKTLFRGIFSALIMSLVAILTFFMTHEGKIESWKDVPECCRHYLTVLVIVQVFFSLCFVLIIYLINKKFKKQSMSEEEKLLLQQRRYQIILDNSEEMLYEISLKDETCISTDKIRQKFGWDIPKSVDKLDINRLFAILHIHPEDESQFFHSTSGLITNKQSRELLIRMQRIDGVYLWCKLTYLPLLDKAGNMVSIVGKIDDVDAEVKEKERLELQSRTDGLTGLINKQTFEEEVIKFLISNVTMGSALVFIDMDHFKEVNDKFGHSMGDRAIRDTALKLQIIFANCDLVSRFGGDEYCIFVKNIPRDTLIDKLAWAVEKLKETYSDGDTVVHLTASIGVAYCMADKADYMTLLEAADNSLYAAKEMGRSRYIIRDIWE